MSDADKGVLLEVITPREMFYSGQVELVVVPTTEGEEGFMAHHVWCVKLLAEKGRVKIREVGAKNLKLIDIKGGHVDIKDRFVVYTDEAVWTEE
ncbi:F0F1 ATP synthase subunit epsilon [uncultured Eubacterium sp.]|uniref:F0F1 ATP synthase subunit epsilon n=1 Tax=Emergencia sp. TaxID=1926557 RepID=UPI000822FF04|nr:F0F1 ATP synthase subunit epsilon [uncultured Eubacterium sp.]